MFWQVILQVNLHAEWAFEHIMLVLSLILVDMLGMEDYVWNFLCLKSSPLKLTKTKQKAKDCR